MDEAQYIDKYKDRSPTSNQLIEVYTGTDSHKRGTEKEPEEQTIDLHEKRTYVTMDVILNEILEASPQPYTAAVASTIRMKAYKALYKRPEIEDLKMDLDTIDVSTNKYFNTIYYTTKANGMHPNLGLKVKQHPDIRDAFELVSIATGTMAHRAIKAWKRNI